MEAQDKEIIDLKLTALRAELQARDELITLNLQQILAQTTKTNGRVTKLEETTTITNKKLSVWYWFVDKPKRLLLFGVIYISTIKEFREVFTYDTIEKIIKLL